MYWSLVELHSGLRRYCSRINVSLLLVLLTYLVVLLLGCGGFCLLGTYYFEITLLLSSSLRWTALVSTPPVWQIRVLIAPRGCL